MTCNGACHPAEPPGGHRACQTRADSQGDERQTHGEGQGLELTLKVIAYDNGMIAVDGVPINESPNYDSGEGWLGAAEVATATLSEFRRQAEKRKAAKS
jgi:hypothetical protein